MPGLFYNIHSGLDLRVACLGSLLSLTMARRSKKGTLDSSDSGCNTCWPPCSAGAPRKDRGEERAHHSGGAAKCCVGSSSSALHRAPLWICSRSGPPPLFHGLRPGSARGTSRAPRCDVQTKVIRKLFQGTIELQQTVIFDPQEHRA